MVFPADDRVARDLAVAAGERLLRLRAAASGVRGPGGAPGPGGAASPGGPGSDRNGNGAADRLRRAGDLGSHEFLAAELGRLRPDDAVLSEEAADDRARLAASRVWIVDPLDGTREFGEPGRVDWAVHVALWERGELSAGAVALPAQGTVLSTAEPPEPPRREPERRLRLVVSRSRPPEFVQRLAGHLDAELVPLGSAGAKAAAVITGDVDAYVHSGGQYEWDSAAPVAVARAGGLHTSRIDGSELDYNQEQPWMPDILICPVMLAGRLLDAISAVRREDE